MMSEDTVNKRPVGAIKEEFWDFQFIFKTGNLRVSVDAVEKDRINKVIRSSRTTGFIVFDTRNERYAFNLAALQGLLCSKSWNVPEREKLPKEVKIQLMLVGSERELALTVAPDAQGGEPYSLLSGEQTQLSRLFTDLIEDDDPRRTLKVEAGEFSLVASEITHLRVPLLAISRS